MIFIGGGKAEAKHIGTVHLIRIAFVTLGARPAEGIIPCLRYEYDGLNLLRIDERYDGEAPAGLDENDPWRPLNVFIHGPGAIGQIVKGKWYNYYSDGQDPANCCDSGEYYYFYDALGNVNGVLDEGGHYYRWEMDAFGNDLPSGNSFLDMDQPGPKEHLTGKMFDTTTGLYYFHARWYDPQVGRFVSRDPVSSKGAGSLCLLSVSSSRMSTYVLADNRPSTTYDPSGKQSEGDPLDVAAVDRLVDRLAKEGACDICPADRCGAFAGQAADHFHGVGGRIAGIRSDKLAHFFGGGACSACSIPTIADAITQILPGLSCQVWWEEIREGQSSDWRDDYIAAIRGAYAAGCWWHLNPLISFNGEVRINECKECLRRMISSLHELKQR